MKLIKLLHAIEILSVKSVTDLKPHLLSTIIVHLAFKIMNFVFSDHIIMHSFFTIMHYFETSHLHCSIYFHYIIYWSLLFVSGLKVQVSLKDFNILTN